MTLFTGRCLSYQLWKQSGLAPTFCTKKSNTCITISEGILCGKNCSCFTSTLCNKSIFANNLWDLLIAVYLCRETQWWLLAHHGVCAHLLVVGWHPLNSAHRILHVSPPCHSYTRLIICGPLWWNDKITFLILNKVWPSTCAFRWKALISGQLMFIFLKFLK